MSMCCTPLLTCVTPGGRSVCMPDACVYVPGICVRTYEYVCIHTNACMYILANTSHYGGLCSL